MMTWNTSRSICVRFRLLAPLALAFACSSAPEAPETGAGTSGKMQRSALSVVPPSLAEVDCGGLAPEAHVCVKQADGANGWVRYRGTVLAPNTIYRNGGEVLVDQNGIIRCVGCDCDATPEGVAATAIACGSGVISPGLINTHDHIRQSNNAPAALDSTRYDHRHEWRLGLNSKPQLSFADNANAVAKQVHEMRSLFTGTTATAGGDGVSRLVRNLDQPGMLEGALVQPPKLSVFPLDDGGGILHASGCDYGPNRATATSIVGLDAFMPHVAEGIDANAQNEFVCASAAGAYDIVEAQTAVIHEVATTAAAAAALRAERSVVSWAPRSNIALYGDTARVTLLHASGVPIALGTDWILTGSMNLLRELHCADSLNTSYFGGYFGDFQLWQMVTTNAALATGVAHGLGQLKPGYLADITVFDARVHADYRAVLDATPADVALVLRGGKPIYGNFDVMADLGSSCEIIDSVCGSTKRFCAQAELGKSYEQFLIDHSSEFSYSIWECGAPPGEPTCVPTRTVPSTYPVAGDSDGDGIVAGDLCPSVFSPIRPLDNGSQANADNDGLGDACDPCPRTPGGSGVCAPPDPDDLDGDGVRNGADNCPRNANSNQDDADGDGKGNPCDACDAFANPGLIPCPKAIQVVRNPAASGAPALLDPVLVQTLYVSALRPATASQRGFYAQHKSATPLAFGGIFVNTGSVAPSVAPGNRVNVMGLYQVEFGLSQIINPILSVTATGTPLVPSSIADPASIATTGADAEKFESMLLRVAAVAVEDPNPDAPSDFDEFVVSGGLRIDDQLHTALDNVYPEGTSFSSISGVLTYTFGDSKLLPRAASDLAP
jgi:cytosine/adenosine deaminase-related metal-dependent hydrolase